jgi:palmitoyl-[glycerolipid] 3-(E)-desaturase
MHSTLTPHQQRKKITSDDEQSATSPQPATIRPSTHGLDHNCIIMKNGSNVTVAALCLAAAAVVGRSLAFTLRPQHHHSFRTGTTIRSRRNPSLGRELFSSSAVEQNKNEEKPAATTTPTPISWKDDGFVFGLPGSGLARPKGKVAVTVVDGDSLVTQPYQVVLVTTTFVTQAVCLVTAMVHLWTINGGDIYTTLAQTAALILTSWIAADFGSGVLHWSVDNYGNGQTPIFGSIIAAFQGHHAAPWTITERDLCNNVYKLCLPFGILPTVLVSLLTPPPVSIFIITFCMFEILSQEFHKWSHMTKRETPVVAATLQQYGIAVPRTQHALHHLAPYEGNYCIISGLCNRILDETGLFRRFEHFIYQWNGVEANAWKLDPVLRARTISGDYRFVSSHASSNNNKRDDDSNSNNGSTS